MANSVITRSILIFERNRITAASGIAEMPLFLYKNAGIYSADYFLNAGPDPMHVNERAE